MLECPAEMTLVREADGQCDLAQWLTGIAEAAAGGFDSEAAHTIGYRTPVVTAELTG